MHPVTYLLGMILYELIELKARTRGNKALQCSSRAMSREHSRIQSEHLPFFNLSSTKATAYDINDRYPNVTELLKICACIFEVNLFDAHPENIFRRSWRFLSKNPLIPLGALFLLLLCISLLTIYSLRNNLNHQTALRENQEITAALIDTVSKEARLIDNMLGSVLLRLNGLTKATSLLYSRETSQECVFSKEISQLPDAQKNQMYGKYSISLAQASLLCCQREPNRRCRIGVQLGPLLREDFYPSDTHLKKMTIKKTSIPRSNGCTSEQNRVFWSTIQGLFSFPMNMIQEKDLGIGMEKTTSNPCSNPYPDSGGTGYLLPCNQRIEGPDGTFIGVKWESIWTRTRSLRSSKSTKVSLLNEDLEIMPQSSDKGEKIFI